MIFIVNCDASCTENNTAVEVVEVHTCSSAILQCGTLLSSTPGLIPVLEWDWNGTELSNGLSNVRMCRNKWYERIAVA